MEAILRHWGWVIAAGGAYLAFLSLVSMFFMSTARAHKAWDAWAQVRVRDLREGRLESARTKLPAVLPRKLG